MAKLLSKGMALSAIVEPGTAETTNFYSANLLFREMNVEDTDTSYVDLAELKTGFSKTGGAIGRQLKIFRPGFALQSWESGARASYRLGRIYRMCGMSETLSVDGSTATYKFRDANFETGAVSFHRQAVTGNGLLYRANTVSGNVRMSGSAGQIIAVDTELRGLYEAPVAQAAPTIYAPANNIATMKGEGMKITPVGGAEVTPIGKSFALDFGITVNENLDFNAANAVESLAIGDRNSTLQVVIQLDSAAELVWAAALTANTKLDVEWTHKDADAGYTHFKARGQLQRLPKADQNNFQVVTLDMVLVHATAGEELVIDAYRG